MYGLMACVHTCVATCNHVAWCLLETWSRVAGNTNGSLWICAWCCLDLSCAVAAVSHLLNQPSMKFNAVTLLQE
jgi:hypothetical protein